MARFLKWLGIGSVAVALLLVLAISLTIGWRPFFGPKARPLTDRTFVRTPERMARGKYLFSGCEGCHSPHDWTQHDAPVPSGMHGAGQILPFSEGVPGRVVAPNLTPDLETGAGAWTDDMLARAIREGIGQDGRALFPMMPYPHLRFLSDEDVASLVVYIRSLPPVRNTVPKTEIVFPVIYLIRSVPEPITAPVPPPDLSTPLKRGDFLINVSGCSDCHTPQRHGEPIKGLEYAGGFILAGPWGRVASANLTPDPSGIPYYDEALFLQAMRTGYVQARKLNQIMPWWDLRNLSDDDLKAMFVYLRTLKPVHHRVDNAEAPSQCKICGSNHGAGNQN